MQQMPEVVKSGSLSFCILLDDYMENIFIAWMISHVELRPVVPPGIGK